MTIRLKIIIPVLLVLAAGLCLLPGCVKKDYINNTTNGQIDPGKASVYHDGTFSAKSQYYDTYGYGQRLTLEIHQGILTKITFTETSRSGEVKSVMDPSWQSNTDKKNLSDLYHAMADQIITQQSASNVDTVSGATQTTAAYKKLASAALDNSKNNGKEASISDINQTYNAEVVSSSDPSVTCKLSVTYKDGNISNVTYDETKDGGQRSVNLAYKQLFSGLTKKTQDSQSLANLPVEPTNPEEITDYNNALNVIASQRTAY